MTRDDAVAVTEMVLNSWSTPQWSEGQVERFVEAVEAWDADDAVAAVALAHRELRFRPSFSELREFYGAVRASRAPERPAGGGVRPTRMPQWVKRWVAARWLHAAFGRERDMRPFPEQHGHVDPVEEQMPPDEWVAEAGQVSDEQAWEAIRGGR